MIRLDIKFYYFAFLLFGKCSNTTVNFRRYFS